jgi:iron-binding CDGSH zinc finger protein
VDELLARVALRGYGDRDVANLSTGALHFERLDGGAQERPDEVTTARPILKGPLFLRGDIEVFDEVGQPIRRDTRIAICRCGRSRHSPFCDNAHRAKVRVTLGGGAPTLSLGRLE